MHRLIVALLSTVDAAIAAAVGVAAILAPLTLLWVVGFGGGAADWTALWPVTASIWQLGHLVSLDITLPGDYLVVAGIDPSVATFTLSLAPLAFAGFAVIFAARSGVRASRADGWITGVLTGAGVFALVATVLALTSGNPIADTAMWQAILAPSLVYALPLLVGAVVTEWREAGSGLIARVRDRVEAAPRGWGDAIGVTARGTAVVVIGMLGLGALLVAVLLILRGGEVIALYEAAHVDAVGATVVTLGQLAYLPNLVIWALSFIAGPGFALGTATAVSPAGTVLGVVPGIPLLGIIPASTSPWLLLLALLPVGLGAFAGWIARSRLVAHVEHTEHEPFAARTAVTAAIAVLSAAAAALLAWAASGSLGPGTLAEVGPAPGPVALAVGVEVAVGAGILLLSPRRAPRDASSRGRDEDEAAQAEPASDDGVDEPASAVDSERATPSVD